MGEAEAPAPPPAVPQNPIKIFISGNSGNKEVSSSQGFIGGLIRVYWGAHKGILGGILGGSLPAHHSHTPGTRPKTFPISPPRFLSIFPLSSASYEKLSR